MTRPEAVFVVGPEDSGKSTRIASEMPDHVHVFVKFSGDPGPVLAQAERQFKKALSEQRDVAVESTSERDLYRRIALAAEAGFAVRIVRTAASEE